MAPDPSKKPQRGWRAAPAKSEPAARGKRGWQQSEAPAKPTLTPGQRRWVMLGSWLAGLGIALGLLLWWIFQLRPVQPACLVLIGAGYETNLALPHNAAGWKGLDEMAQFADQSSQRFQFWKPAADHLHLLFPTQAVKADTNLIEDVWPKVVSSFREQTVILFLSLHGGVDAKGEPFLFGDDSKLEKRIYVKEILEKLNDPKLKGKKKLLILDATQLTAHWPSGMLHNEFVNRLRELEDQIKRVPDLVILCASDADQRSWVSPEWQRTIFAHYVLEGLKGAADSCKTGDNNKCVTAWELHQYVRDRVQAWSDSNRDAPQTPILLGNEEAAKSMELTLPAEEYTEQSYDKAPGRESSALASLEKDIETAWTVWADLKAARPHPAVYSPHLWHAYQDTLVRYEELLRLGDPTDKKGLLKGELARLADGIRKSKEGLDFYASAGNGVWMPAVLGLQPALPDGLEARLRVLEEEIKKQSRPDAKGEKADPDKAWKELLGAAKDLATNHPVFEMQLSRLAFLALPDAETVNYNDLNDKAELLDWIYTKGKLPLAAEPNLLFRLKDELLDKKYAPAKVIPAADLRQALKGRLLAEQTALGSPTLEGAEHPYSEIVWLWIQKKITDADTKRRLGEDYLFGSTETSWKEARKQLDAAEKLYGAAKEQAQDLRQALQQRDRALAVLPYFARWVAEQWLVDATQGRKAQVETWRDLVDKLDQASVALNKALDLQAAGSAKGPDDAKVDLPELTRSVAKIVDDLNTEFAKECDDLRNPAQQQKRWHYLQSVLAVPLVSEAHQRWKFVANSRDISAKFHEGLAKQSVQTSDRPPPADVAREQAKRQGLMALAAAGEPWTGKQTRDDVRKWITGAPLKEWRAEVANAGNALAAQWATRLQTIRDNWAKSLDAKDLAEAAKLIGPAEHWCRLASTANVYEQIPAKPFDPVQAARRLRLHDLLCQQAVRTWQDHWTSATDNKKEPYYFLMAQNYLKDADKLAESKDEQVLNTARKQIVADLRAKIVPARLEAVVKGDAQQYLTGNESEVTWNFQAGDGVPVGKPMVWLEVKGEWVKNPTDPTYVEHVPLKEWVSLPKSYSLTNKTYNDQDPFPLPEELPATVTLRGVYRGQKIESKVAVLAYNAPDIVATRFPPLKNEAKVSLHLEKDVSFGSVCMVLDFSGSMAWDLDGKVNAGTPKIKYVRNAFAKVLDTIPKGTHLSVVAFGAKGKERFEWVWPKKKWLASQNEIELLNQNISSAFLTPDGFSPIAEAMREAKNKGFADIGENNGPKVMLVLTDGYDNDFGGKMQNAATDKNAIRDFMKDEFGESDVEINMICFTKNATEEKTARDQFDVITKFKLPFAPTGKFEQVPHPDDLADKLKDSLRPKLTLYPDDGDAGTFAKVLLGTFNKDNPNSKDLQVAPGKGSRFIAQAQKGPKYQIDLRPGEYLPLVLAPGLGKALELRREVFGTRFPTAKFTLDKKWLGAVPETIWTANQSWLSQLVTLEKPNPAAGDVLKHQYPRFVWLELPDQKGKKPRGLRWYPPFGKKAPAWRVQGRWLGDDRLNGEDSRLSAWLLDGVPDESIAQSYLLEQLGPGKKLTVQELSFTVQKVYQGEDRFVMVRPDKKEKRLCLVVEITYPAGCPVWLRPDVPCQGEEHLYFTKAGRYVALFWGGEPSRFDVISIKHLKAAAKEGQASVEALEWNSLSAEKGPVPEDAN